MEHLFDHVNEGGRYPAFQETIPSKVINTDRKMPKRGRLLGAICHSSMSFIEQIGFSIMSAKVGATLALSRISIIVSIELCSCSRRPGSVHLVRCFDVTFSHPHCGHLLMTVSSHSDNLKLHPHHPDTCFVMNIQKGVGYSDMALSQPGHHMESK